MGPQFFSTRAILNFLKAYCLNFKGVCVYVCIVETIKNPAYIEGGEK